MKTKNVILLAKYAQGLIIFNSFFDYIAYLNSEDRQNFLLQTTKLICHLEPGNTDVEIAIRNSGCSENSELCLLLKEGLVLKEGLECEDLQKLVGYEKIDMEGTFKLLLSLFTEVYQRAYQSNKDKAAKFWYWDYSDPQASFRVLELDLEQAVDIEKF